MATASDNAGTAQRVDWATIVAALGHGIVALDEELRIVACNPAAERLLGRSASELAGRGAWELGLDVVGEDGVPVATDAALARAALRQVTNGHSALVGISAEGARRWLRLTAVTAPFGAAGADGTAWPSVTT